MLTEQRFRFGRLWLATVASNLGDGLVLAAFPLLAATFSRDPLAVAGLTAAAGLPWLLLGPFSGAVVDRFDRRKLMWTFDVGRAIVVGTLAVAIAAGLESLAALYVVVFLIAAGETIVDTSSQAMLPALVARNRLDRSNGRLFSTMMIAHKFVGPPLGGFLFGVAIILPVAADAVSFAIAAIVIASLTGRFKPGDSAAAPMSILASTREGLRFLWSNRPIRSFAIGAAALNIGIVAGDSILVLFAQDQLDLSGLGFGLLIASTAAGYTIGSFVAPAIVVRANRLVVVLTSVTSIGLALFGIAAAPSAVVAGAALGVIGIASGLWDVIAVSYRQAAVPDRMLGRIMAAYRVVAHGSIPIGALIGGTVARLSGNRAPFVVGAVVILLAVPFLLTSLRGVELDPALISD